MRDREGKIIKQKYPKVNMWEETGPSCTSFKCCRFIFLIDSLDSELLSVIDRSASLSVSITFSLILTMCSPLHSNKTWIRLAPLFCILETARVSALHWICKVWNCLRILAAPLSCTLSKQAIQWNWTFVDPFNV